MRLLLLAALAAALGLSQDSDDHLKLASRISAELRAIPVEVPAPTSSLPTLLAKMKAEMREWLETRFSSLDPDVTAGAVQAALEKSLERRKMKSSQARPEDGPFGSITGIRVSSVETDQDLRLVVVSYDSYCPSDDSVLLFERRGGRWELAIHFDNDDYVDYAGDRQLLFAGVSPRDAGGNYYLLVVRTRSYCPESGSLWNNINYHLLRPGASATAPKVLLSAKHGYYQNDDFRAQVQAGSFLMEFPAWSDTTTGARTHVLRYSVGLDYAERVEPVAVNARDFVEEWVMRPWSEAAAWSAPERRPALEVAHQKLHPKPDSRWPEPDADYAVIRYCSEDRKRILVSFPAGPDNFVFLVREGDRNIYRMEFAAEGRIPCEGREVPEQQVPRHILPDSFNRAGR